MKRYHDYLIEVWLRDFEATQCGKHFKSGFFFIEAGKVWVRFLSTLTTFKLDNPRPIVEGLAKRQFCETILGI